MEAPFLTSGFVHRSRAVVGELDDEQPSIGGNAPVMASISGATELSLEKRYQVNAHFVLLRRTCAPIIRLAVDIRLSNEYVLCSDNWARHTRVPLKPNVRKQGANGGPRECTSNQGLAKAFPPNARFYARVVSRPRPLRALLCKRTRTTTVPMLVISQEYSRYDQGTHRKEARHMGVSAPVHAGKNVFQAHSGFVEYRASPSVSFGNPVT